MPLLRVEVALSFQQFGHQDGAAGGTTETGGGRPLWAVGEDTRNDLDKLTCLGERGGRKPFGFFIAPPVSDRYLR